MFAALNIYRIVGTWVPSLGTMEEALAASKFVPCGPSQDKSVGWVAPRGEQHGALVESVNGQRILKLMIETKSVPASAIKKKVDEACEHIEQTTARNPGRKERKELKEDAYLALLPAAFPRQSAVLVWIDLENKLLLTDASNQGREDEAITALVRSFDGLTLALLQTNMAPATAMACWLQDGGKLTSDDRFGFDIGRACELESGDEEKAVVKFKNHNLDTDEVKKHITDGKLPTRLALEYDGRIALTLGQTMRLTGIKYLEGIFKDGGTADEKNEGFDADVALATSELQRLIPNLIEALGGELSVDKS